MRPLLFLDVDGPLNPFQAKPSKRPDGYLTYRIWTSVPTPMPGRRKPLRVWLKPSHGEELLALPYELVWATTWTHEANQKIGPELGLPVLPVVSWPEQRRSADGLHWKTREIVE
ncbi:hypothetical protein AB5J62_35200 [Amycolatopsis sp. cg5]|uniref:hypothetical protein n=1 Tax=Amycolatopsis sp. cg5 TaxID=3238802 RepID=UPI003523EAB7